MDSIDFLFGFDCQLKYDSDLDLKDDNNCDNSLFLVKNQIFNSSQFNKEFVVNDVFLNQNNGFDSMVNNHQNTNNKLNGEKDVTNGKLLDDICSEQSVESLTNQSLFGCICCHSCQLKSQEFMTKSNDLIRDFKCQVNKLKDNVRQSLSEFNTQINETRLKFSTLLVDLKVKLNEKNSQLEKIVNLIQFLSRRNDILSHKLKDNIFRFENVCKENIQLRDKLGIKLKVVLNSDECKKAIKEFEQNKLNDGSASSVRIIGKDDIKTDNEEESQNCSSVSGSMSQTSLQSIKQLSPLNNSLNSNDLEQQIKYLLDKYKELQDISSSKTIDKKRRREKNDSSPQKYQMVSDSKPTERQSQRLKEQKNDHEMNCPEDGSKEIENETSKSCNVVNVLTPISTYSKSSISHKPLILSKSSHKSLKSISNNNQNKNNYHFNNGYHPKSSHSMDSINKTSFHYLNQFSTINSNQNSRLKEIKIEPRPDLVKIDNDEIKAKIKVPKKRKRDSEKSRFCKRCNQSFPDLSSKEFKEHIYNVCPAREVLNRDLISCKFCPRQFLTTSALTSHQRSKHKDISNMTANNTKTDLQL